MKFRRFSLKFAIVVLVAVGFGLLALRLQAHAGQDTLANGGSVTAKATDRLHRRFGDEPITILIKADRGRCPGHSDCHLTNIVLTPDLLKILSLEGCLSGNVPPRAKPPAPECARLAATKPFASVSGPGTFVNESARQITARVRAAQAGSAAKAEQAARAARKVAAARGLSKIEQDRLAREARQLAALNALQPALRYGLSTRGPQVIDVAFVHDLVFDAAQGFDMPKTRFSHLFPNRNSAQIEIRPRAGLTSSELGSAVTALRHVLASPKFRLDSASYFVAGLPIETSQVASHVSASVAGLGVAALLLTALALVLLVRSRAALLVLLPVGAGVLAGFGIVSLFSGSLSLASVAAVPAVFALATPVVLSIWAPNGRREARAGWILPVFALVAFLLSPAPMVRSLVVLVALCVALAALAAVALRTQLRVARAGARRPRLASTLGDVASRVRAFSVRAPVPVLAVGTLLAIAGWGLQGQIGARSSLDRLSPGHIAGIRDVRKLEHETGRSADVSVLVEARDVTAPAVLSWMSGYERRVLSSNGYREKAPCSRADICPAVSLTDLLGGNVRGRKEIAAVVKSLPRSFTRGVISADHHAAVISFSLRAMREGKQDAVVRDLRRELDPPRGVGAHLAGTPALTEATDRQVRRSLRLFPAIALLVAFLVMLAIRRSLAGAALAVAPAVVVTGWMFLAMLVVGLPVNPLSAILTGLIALLFSIGFGASVRSAPSIREEEVAIAVVALAGLTALVLSDAPMISDFGIDALVAGAVALVGVALVLPATLTLTEEGALGAGLRDVVSRAKAGWRERTRVIRRRERRAER